MAAMNEASNSKKGLRMAGTPLRVAARLFESPASGPLLFKVGIKQLGVEQLREIDLPVEAAPYRPWHLGGSGSEDDRD